MYKTVGFNKLKFILKGSSCCGTAIFRSLNKSAPSWAPYLKVVPTSNTSKCNSILPRLNLQPETASTNSYTSSIVNTNLLSSLRSQNRTIMTEVEQQDTVISKFPTRDLTFENSYGHIAAVEWGNSLSPHKILCVHGWLDNLSTFEGLVPGILNHKNHEDLYHVVAFDMPGVGHSSHLPTGATYTSMTTILEMRRILQKLNWEKVILVSHSLGAHLSFIYSCLYPKQVETLVTIDLPHPMAAPPNVMIANLLNSVEEHFKCEYSHGDDPTDNMGVLVYSRQDAIDRIMQGHSNSLTERSAEILLKRGARKERWGYTFNRDVRLRYMNLEMKPSDELMFELLNFSFRPNLLNIVATGSPYKRPDSVKNRFYKMYERKCPVFQEIQLEGTHHLHMNNPIPVAQEINKFLELVRDRQGGDSTSHVGGGETFNKL